MLPHALQLPSALGGDGDSSTQSEDDSPLLFAGAGGRRDGKLMDLVPLDELMQADQEGGDLLPAKLPAEEREPAARGEQGAAIPLLRAARPPAATGAGARPGPPAAASLAGLAVSDTDLDGLLARLAGTGASGQGSGSWSPSACSSSPGSADAPSRRVASPAALGSRRGSPPPPSTAGLAAPRLVHSPGAAARPAAGDAYQPRWQQGSPGGEASPSRIARNPGVLATGAWRRTAVVDLRQQAAELEASSARPGDASPAHSSGVGPAGMAGWAATRGAAASSAPSSSSSSSDGDLWAALRARPAPQTAGRDAGSSNSGGADSSSSSSGGGAGSSSEEAGAACARGLGAEVSTKLESAPPTAAGGMLVSGVAAVTTPACPSGLAAGLPAATAADQAAVHRQAAAEQLAAGPPSPSSIGSTGSGGSASKTGNGRIAGQPAAAAAAGAAGPAAAAPSADTARAASRRAQGAPPLALPRHACVPPAGQGSRACWLSLRPPGSGSTWTTLTAAQALEAAQAASSVQAVRYHPSVLALLVPDGEAAAQAAAGALAASGATASVLPSDEQDAKGPPPEPCAPGEEALVCLVRQGGLATQGLLAAVLRAAAGEGLVLGAAATLWFEEAAVGRMLLVAHAPLPGEATVALLLRGHGHAIRRWQQRIGPSADLAACTDPGSLHAFYGGVGTPPVRLTCSLDARCAAAEATALFPAASGGATEGAAPGCPARQEAAVVAGAATPAQQQRALAVLAAVAQRFSITGLHTSSGAGPAARDGSSPAGGGSIVAVVAGGEVTGQLPCMLVARAGGAPGTHEVPQVLLGAPDGAMRSMGEPSRLAAGRALDAAREAVGAPPGGAWHNSSGHAAEKGVVELAAVCLPAADAEAALAGLAARLASSPALRLVALRMTDRLPAGTHAAFCGGSGGSGSEKPSAPVRLPAGRKLVAALLGMDARQQLLLGAAGAPCDAAIAGSHAAAAHLVAHLFGPDCVLGGSAALAAALAAGAPSRAACRLPCDGACLPALAQLLRTLDKDGYEVEGAALLAAAGEAGGTASSGGSACGTPPALPCPAADLIELAVRRPSAQARLPQLLASSGLAAAGATAVPADGPPASLPVAAGRTVVKGQHASALQQVTCVVVPAQASDEDAPGQEGTSAEPRWALPWAAVAAALPALHMDGFRLVGCRVHGRMPPAASLPRVAAAAGPRAPPRPVLALALARDNALLRLQMAGQGSHLLTGPGAGALTALLRQSLPVPGTRAAAEAQLAALFGSLAAGSPWQLA